jgi:hypothetical protein
MMDSGSPPDPRILELLRRGTPVDPAAKGRVRERLGESILGTAAVSVAGVGGARVARSTASQAYGLVAAAFLAGSATGAAVYARFAGPAPAREVRVDRPAATEPTTRVEATPAVTSSAQPASPAPEVAPPSARLPSRRASGPSQLSAERRVLDEARRAVLQGDATTALGLVERHRLAFPSPILGEERAALEVQALGGAGRYSEARARGAAFRHHFPDSLYSPAVEATLATLPAE